MGRKLFADDDFRNRIRVVLERVLWYLKFDLGAKDLKNTIAQLLAHIDEELDHVIKDREEE